MKKTKSLAEFVRSVVLETLESWVSGSDVSGKKRRRRKKRRGRRTRKAKKSVPQ